MASKEPLFRRVDSAERGRHLVASSALERGRLIFAERPLLALQSLHNLSAVQVCHHCKAFVGGPVRALRRRFTRRPPEGGNGTEGCPDDVVSSSNDAVMPCRELCGHVFCCVECETDAWHAHHQYLCTGHCDTERHPLVRFKQFAVETNEILLLVAEWWVAQHTATSDEEAEKYTDFQMNPWWDVVTADLLQQPGGFGEAAALQQPLRQVCEEAADLLSQALASTEIPDIAALDISIRIGACEQNAIGIRQRHPLCRDVFDVDVRTACHAEIIDCLQEAGFIGNEGDEGVKVQSETDDAGPGSEPQDGSDDVEEWDYSIEEIASFLSGLHIDEDGSVRDQAVPVTPDRLSEDGTKQEGDDLDYIFPPLDGTAMYSTACKMNHSCDPNVLVVYRRRTGFGARHPLTAYCVALKDIETAEELTISYIDAEKSYEERKAALASYGFTCNCAKCSWEGSEVRAPAPRVNTQEDFDDPFGSEDDDTLNGEDEDISDFDGDDNGEEKLKRCLERLDTAANHSLFGTIPLQILGSVSSFVIQLARIAGKEIGDDDAIAVIRNLLDMCADGLQERDFRLCEVVGSDLEELLFSILRKESQWKNPSYREAYWCSTLTAAVGRSHDYNFLESLHILDKGFVLGLPRSDERIGGFFDYVEKYAFQASVGPYSPAISTVVPDYHDQEMSDLVQNEGLSRQMQFPIMQLHDPPALEAFLSDYVAHSKALVLRGLASNWPAISKWRDLKFFAREHGHRLVPTEVGSMMDGSMKEELQSFRGFTKTFLCTSTMKKFWRLKDATVPSTRVGYLAQHPLLGQIPSLQLDLEMRPEFCGSDGPTHVYVWVGTGGTRTPLHFDSYDNLFVQLVGAKYVRLYKQEETPKLYVSQRSAFGLQGNMSDVDCEREDWTQHPLAQSASYKEVLLLPGDALFVPARQWHYVRSLSTSISVNYWF